MPSAPCFAHFATEYLFVKVFTCAATIESLTLGDSRSVAKYKLQKVGSSFEAGELGVSFERAGVPVAALHPHFFVKQLVPPTRNSAEKKGCHTYL